MELPTFDQAGRAAVDGNQMGRLYWAALAMLTTYEPTKTPEEVHQMVTTIGGVMYADEPLQTS